MGAQIINFVLDFKNTEGEQEVVFESSIPLKTCPKFWRGLQDDFDIEEGQNQIADELNDIEQIKAV